MSLSRPAAAAAVADLGWQYVLGTFRASVPVGSIGAAARVLDAAAEASGGSDHLRAHVTAHRVEVTLQPPDGEVDEADVALAGRITAALREHGTPPTAGDATRPAQSLEIAIDALDHRRLMPFWQAVLAYVPDPLAEDALVDPLHEGPSVWFQQMDAPRPQRNRIHLDVTVPPEVAEQRVAAALAAGGTLVSDAHARSFWVLADAEGNEACVCTWQDRE